MANTKGSANIKSFMHPAKHALLPPKSPFPTVSSSYADYAQTTAVGSKVLQKPKEGNTHHQRTSSESILVEEQPSWLDDLLNEPETPVRRGGHRRSSSDSFAYLDAPNLYNTSYATPDRYRNMGSVPLWGAQDFDNYRDARLTPQYTEANLPNSRALNPGTHSRISPARDNIIGRNLGIQSAAKEGDGVPATATGEKQDTENGSHDSKTSSEKKDGSQNKSETDTKRAKQQFAQRSRVRKLQYIAELERNVQALQAEGSEISAEVEFLNQQTLILSMENKALKQRLESLAQEQLIKYMEHEMLEREIGRLRALYQQLQQPQQQPQQQKSSGHRRTTSRDLDSQFASLSRTTSRDLDSQLANLSRTTSRDLDYQFANLSRTTSRDLDSQFANLSLRHNDASSSHDSVTGQLRT